MKVKSAIKTTFFVTNGAKQKEREKTDFEVILSQSYAKYILAFENKNDALFSDKIYLT